MLASDLRIRRIAELVGYRSLWGFISAFKRWARVRPSTFRGHSLLPENYPLSFRRRRTLLAAVRSLAGPGFSVDVEQKIAAHRQLEILLRHAWNHPGEILLLPDPAAVLDACRNRLQSTRDEDEKADLLTIDHKLRKAMRLARRAEKRRLERFIGGADQQAIDRLAADRDSHPTRDVSETSHLGCEVSAVAGGGAEASTPA